VYTKGYYRHLLQRLLTVSNSASMRAFSIPQVRPNSLIPQTRTSHLTPLHPPHYPEQPLPPPVSSPRTPSSSGNNPCGAHIRTSSSLATCPLVRQRPRSSLRWRRGRVWLWSANRRLSGSLGLGGGCRARSYDAQGGHEEWKEDERRSPETHIDPYAGTELDLLFIDILLDLPEAPLYQRIDLDQPPLIHFYHLQPGPLFPLTLSPTRHHRLHPQFFVGPLSGFYFDEVVVGIFVRLPEIGTVLRFEG
jgi:hypothetical protein